jgi:hypothetical protein
MNENVASLHRRDILIQEEMHRVVMFYEWKAQWWQSQACCRTNEDHSVIHGVAAYAKKQAHLCECFAQSCVTSWLPMLKVNGATSDWEAHYHFVPTTAAVSGETPTDSDSIDDDESAKEIDNGGDEKGECSKGNQLDDNVDIDLFEVD